MSAGLRENDMIVRINGNNLGAWTVTDVEREMEETGLTLVVFRHKQKDNLERHVHDTEQGDLSPFDHDAGGVTTGS
jgi:C-terminal processing protease CtpA/Prc